MLGHIPKCCILCAQAGGGGVEYSRFQVTGMIKGFFGFEILDFAIFLGRKILATVFSGSLILVGFLGHYDSSRVSWPHSASGNFYGSEIQFFGG